MSAISTVPNSIFTVEGWLGDRTVKILFDTGSPINLIRKSLISGDKIEKLIHDIKLRGVSAEKVTPLGTCIVNVNMPEIRRKLEAYVVPTLPVDMLIGCETMKKWKVILDLESGMISLNKKKLSKTKPLLEMSVCALFSEEENLKSRFEKCVSKNLTGEEKEMVVDVLMKNREAFSINGELGAVETPHCKIVVKPDAVPFKSVPYRVSIAEREIISEKIKEMLEADIIEVSNSEYSSPVLLVKNSQTGGEGKKSESRLVVDLRKLNRISVSDNHPVPYLDSTLEVLAGKSLFFKLDASKGFHQLVLPEDSRKYTAFVTPSGFHQYKRLPFGYKNSAQIYQRMMEDTLRDLLFQYCIVFIDDICGYGKDFDEFILALEKVLKRVQDTGLKLKIEKSAIGEKELICFGHLVSQEGIRPDPAKVKSITEIPPPTNLKGIRSFLGITGFFRKMIPNYATIARPITKLLSKDKPFVWESTQQKAFDNLKQCLIKSPILRPFKEDARTLIHVDASDSGLGAVLLQEEFGKEGVVAYTSRVLSKTEQLYDTTQKEFLALLHALKIFRHYIHMRRFEVFTDHANLLQMKFNQKLNSGRLARWALRISDFDFVLKYVPGRKNSDADGLSRLAVKPEFLPEEDSMIEFPVMTLSIEDHEKLQEEDLFCQNIKKLLTKRDKRACKRYIISEGRLYNVENCNKRYVIPRILIGPLLEKMHGAEKGAHIGFAKLYESIKDKFYFNKMKTRVLKYVASCAICQMNKHVTQRPYGKLQPITIGEMPMDLICLDFFGPICASHLDHHYICVAIDYLSKFIWARGFAQANSDSVYAFLTENIIPIFGPPKAMLTDRAKIFFSSQIKSLCEAWGIKQLYTSGFKSSTNGIAERAIQTITALLRCEVSSAQYNWEKVLPQIIFALNAYPSTVTKTEPYRLMFGMEPRLPELDQVLPEALTERRILSGMELQNARALCLLKIRKTQEKYKERYDATRRAPDFKAGEKIYVKKMTFRPDETRKLSYKYLGPFEIEEILPPNLVKLKVEKGTYNPIVHIEKLRHAIPKDEDTGSETELSEEDEFPPRQNSRGFTTSSESERRKKKSSHENEPSTSQGHKSKTKKSGSETSRDKSGEDKGNSNVRRSQRVRKKTKKYGVASSDSETTG